jgi:hypothetical protein
LITFLDCGQFTGKPDYPEKSLSGFYFNDQEVMIWAKTDRKRSLKRAEEWSLTVIRHCTTQELLKCKALKKLVP